MGLRDRCVNSGLDDREAQSSEELKRLHMPTP